ncbi:flavin-containing monooxygenase FMO GS-OX-like 2 [Rhodamnia argentea]|uniref:Flavin-containing monooxygenase n=1 Tax=Rhodamnia argentea TaxID=178133 RepID=A0ABM3HXY8_9MYRT|nr:flavin-containing monooxygenase FMO GS-OX-like 2 [Rhodamnia argentea]
MMSAARGGMSLGLNPTHWCPSMYRLLRVHLPRKLISFSDYPFLEKGCGDPRSFSGHEEVLRFLRGFTGDFGLVELIRFGHKVVRVERTVEGRGDQWAVERRMGCGEEVAGLDIFDAVRVWRPPASPREIIMARRTAAPEPYKDEVACAEDDGELVFQDGSSMHADVIIHCPGLHQAKIIDDVDNTQGSIEANKPNVQESSSLALNA